MDSKELMEYLKKDKQNIHGIIIIIIIFAYGILGSYFLMNLNLFDSIYYTIITLATVGYGDITPLTPIEKIFSASLALAGIGILAYIVTIIISSITENLQDIRSGRIMEKRLSKMENHYILCGLGRVGTAVFDELRKRNQKVIIIEIDEEKTEYIEEDDDVIILNANATDDKTLKKLNIDKSFGVIITTGSDVDNLYIVLTTRELYKDAWIISRASKKENINRLKHAGANKVISPEASGGNDIYFAAVKPNLIHITERHDIDYIEREIEILRKYDCHMENIEYHLTGIKTPFVKTNNINYESENKFIEKIKTDENVKESLKSMYNIVNNVHSHLISGPDKNHLDKALEELKKEGIVLGVNLDFEEINKITKKYKKYGWE